MSCYLPHPAISRQLVRTQPSPDRTFPIRRRHGPRDARRLELRWIATLYRPFSTKGLMARMIERRQAYADAVVAVSDHVARDALEHFPDLGERLHIIPPGINFDRFDPAVVRADRVIRL